MSRSPSQNPREGRSFAVRDQLPLALVVLCRAFAAGSPPWLIAFLAVLGFTSLSADVRRLFVDLWKVLRRVEWGRVKILFG